MKKLNIPRTELLLLRVQKIELKLIEWCKKNKYSQGDSYCVGITKEGKWVVGYTNDYPLQHGNGERYILTGEEFAQASA